MNKIFESWKKYINEDSPTGELWEAHAILVTRASSSRAEAGLEDFKNSIRVKCGVTIVENDGPSQERQGLLFTRIRIRFIPRGTPKKALSSYTRIISQIDGVKRITFLDKTIIKVSK